MKSNEELLQMAKEAADKAYCHYSKFAVGACALYENGNFYIGCNVENSSYGLGICAERNAISTAVAMGEKSKLIKIAIFSPNTTQCVPCGACRQWLREFEQGQDIEVILEEKDNSIIIYKLSELLPHSFNSNML